MNSENQAVVRHKQPIKFEKPFERSHHFLAALVKEMMAHFQAQIMAENSKQRRKLNSQSSQHAADSVPVNTKIPHVVAPWPVAKSM